MDEHVIAPGVRGWLESPASVGIAEDCLIVSGWAFATDSRIVDVWVTGFGPRRPLRYGLPRDDVAGVYGREPGASRSGFSGYLEFEVDPETTLELEVWAILANGRTIRLFARRLTPNADARESPVRFAVRQAMWQPRLLLSGRAWLRAFALLRRAWLRKSNRPVLPVTFGARKALTRTRRVSLARFLADGTWITFASFATPAVSVIIVVWNRAELTLRCLAALAEHADVAMEVIIVDNASTDETSDLLARIGGATVIRNSSNVGFAVGNNIGAKTAHGDFLLFLNNDAELEPGCLEHLLNTARGTSSFGAVGGKLVYPDGRLQEAGSVIWADGSCDGYGRGSDPDAPEYNFERDVDFCSGALLLTPRAIFEQLGGFDERYRPMYYEDADYCARLWANGHRVRYQPRAVAIHYEFGSAASPEESASRQRARRPVFVSQHGRWLTSQFSRAAGMLAARSHPHGQPSVIVVDDAVPDPRMGSGFGRAAALLQALADAGFLITVYTTAQGQPSRTTVSLPGVEVVAGSPMGIGAFLTSRTRSPRLRDLLIVSRPHNMQHVKAAMGADVSTLGMPCVYDAEAIYALRELGRRRVEGQPTSESDRQRVIDSEIALTRGCAAVLTVSDADQDLFEAAGVRNVVVVGHAVEPCPTLTRWEDRRSILFIGAFSAESPNEDAVTFFCREVLPTVREAGPGRVPFVIAGARMPSHLRSLADASVSWRPDVDDLTPLYEDARVFVAPTRYAAGIPLKLVEAAARGVPIVCTPLLARQLGWAPGGDLLTAETPAEFVRAIADLYAVPDLWLRLREAALRRVAKEYSTSVFEGALQRALTVARRSSADAAAQKSLA